MKVAIVTIGSEILAGQIVDTNSAWMCKELSRIGVSVEMILSISDKRDDIYSTLDSCVSKFDLTLVTGGLGPTKDDITKSVLCEVFGGQLIQHEQSFQQTKEILGLLKVNMNELNCQQSMVPDSCEVIVNCNGTAPGMLFRREDHVLIAMPGVPFEMKEMCTNSIFKIIKENFKLQSNIYCSVVTFGIAESVLAEKIAQWEEDLPKYLNLSYLPSYNRVRLCLSAYGIMDKVSVEQEIVEKFVCLQHIIPEYYIGDEDTEVEVSLAEYLKNRGESLSVAESCTGGAIASKLTRNNGASDFFLGGVIAYDNRIKESVLGVKAEDIDEFGAVSCQVVEQMAQGVRRLMKTTYSIATSGIAGSSGGTEQKPVGTVWIAIDTPQGTFSELHTFSKLREPNIERSSSQGMFYLLKHIKSL